ncbi:MAG: DEAD/DEAH box helicase [Cryomorphaceae bacterium]|nr:MAG: DEAD/DEAH box helicase [Cryomorphaceae bacterium]
MSDTQFTDLPLTRQFLQAVDDMGYTEPTPIQRKAIPVIFSGQDVIGVAQTGTGKTAAYLLPLLRKLNYAQGDAPRMLIFVPTRELAIQVDDMARELAKYTDLRIATVYGGKGKTEQRKQIETGVDLVIATPGRFMDLYLEGAIVVKKVHTLVLDEADRLMDMGFMPQLRSILEVIPRKRQNLLFSATFSKRVEELSAEFLEFPTDIRISTSEKTTETIALYYYRVPNFKTKLMLLEQLLANEETFQRVLIFTRSRTTAENLGRYLQRKYGEVVKILHANKGQQSRINAFEAFRGGALRILVATDVASRGIDVSEVSHVINFELGPDPEHFIHRVGRTGRATREGIALSFVNDVELHFLKRIEKAIKKEIPELTLPETVVLQPYLPDEEQEIARTLDLRKQKEDPEYLGAFHEKKRKPAGSGRKKTGRKKGSRRR